MLLRWRSLFYGRSRHTIPPMGMLDRRSGNAVLGISFGAFAALLLGCQEPTEAFVEISTDALCSDINGTGITAGLIETIDRPEYDTTTSLCHSDGTIGSIVLLPPDDNENAPFAFKVVTSIDGPVESCLGPELGPGCIVARRAMRFVPRTPFHVPVPMRQVCAGVQCPSEQTCADGVCRSPTVDPDLCVDPNGCDLGPGDVPVWQSSFGGVGTQLGRAIALTDNGLLAVTGSFDGTLDLDGPLVTSNGALTSKGGQDIFITTFTQSGLFRWGLSFGGAGNDEGLAVAISPKSDLYVVAGFQGTVDFGAGSLTSAADGTDVALIKLASNGKLRWAIRFGGDTGESGTDVAVDASDNSYVVGSFTGTTTIGSQVLTSAGGVDAFIASFTPSGDLRWAKSIGGAGEDHAGGVGVDAEGRVYITGKFTGEVSMGGPTPLTAVGSGDVFVASFDAQGGYRWATSFGAGGNDIGLDLAARDERVVVTGLLSNKASINGMELNAGAQDGFVAAFDPDGKLAWAKPFGNPKAEEDLGVSVAIAKDGSVAIGGETFNGPIFDSSPTGLKGIGNPFVAVLDANGEPRFSRIFGSGQYASTSSVAIAPDGSAFLAGWFAAELEGPAPGPNGENLTSSDLEDMFLFHVTPP